MKNAVIIAFTSVIIATSTVALEINESGSNYCEGEGACGAGWVWDEQAQECVKPPIS